jgi:hypothetical protein
VSLAPQPPAPRHPASRPSAPEPPALQPPAPEPPERGYASAGVTIRRVADTTAATVRAVQAALWNGRPVAVIAADAEVEGLACALWNADIGVTTSSASGGPGSPVRVAVLPATPAPGLGTRYDHVVLVEPAAIAESGPRGPHCLQAAVTCAVYRLDVLHARPLPPGATGADGVRLRI